MLDSLYRFTGNDKNSYKSPDQSPFSELGEGSHVLGPQFNNAHSRQDSCSLQTGGCVGEWVCVCGWVGVGVGGCGWGC